MSQGNPLAPPMAAGGRWLARCVPQGARLAVMLSGWRWRQCGRCVLRGLSGYALKDIGRSRTDAGQDPKDARTLLEERHWWI
jgi:uncharacterized protein YjiS (DUF1127 family)